MDNFERIVETMQQMCNEQIPEFGQRRLPVFGNLGTHEQPFLVAFWTNVDKVCGRRLTSGEWLRTEPWL